MLLVLGSFSTDRTRIRYRTNRLQLSTGWWMNPLKSHWNGWKMSGPLSKCCTTILRGIGDPARTPVVSCSPVHTWLYPGGFLVMSNICLCHVCTLHTFAIEGSIWNKSRYRIKLCSCACVSQTAFWGTLKLLPPIDYGDVDHSKELTGLLIISQWLYGPIKVTKKLITEPGR